MLNLIIKDVLVQKKSLLIGFLYILVMVIALGNGSLGYTAGIIALVYLLIQTPCAYDDKCRADHLLNSLPLDRKTIVLAKYLSAALYLMVAVAEYSIISLIIRLTGLPFAADAIPAQGFIGLFAVTVVFASFFYPIFFRFGYMKTRYVNLILFAGAFAAGSTLIASMQDNEALRGFIAAINKQPDLLVGGVLVGAMALVLTASCSLSIWFYRKREF